MYQNPNHPPPGYGNNGKYPTYVGNGQRYQGHSQYQNNQYNNHTNNQGPPNGHQNQYQNGQGQHHNGHMNGGHPNNGYQNGYGAQQYAPVSHGQSYQGQNHGSNYGNPYQNNFQYSNGYDTNYEASFTEIKTVNWGQIDNFVQIVKNFYHECEAVANRSTEEVKRWRKTNQVTVVGTADLKPIMEFIEAGIPEYLMQIMKAQKYDTPTVIQSQSWPIALSGLDMIGIARTGSGKTLSFILPAIIHIMAQPDLRPNDGPVALVLCPTRELAKQVKKEAQKFGADCGVNAVAIYGGTDKNRQIAELNKGAHIVVACPGRLLDLLNQGKINLHRTTYLVLDEADRMLDMGFEPQIRKVIGQIRAERQTLMFSATWPKSVQTLAADFATSATKIYIGNQGMTVNKNIEQIVECIQQYDKKQFFMNFYLAAASEEKKILIFTDTKRECDNLTMSLKQSGYQVAALHGDKDQREREYVLKAFRSGKIMTVVATDVAARGLDIEDIGYVINYDFPQTVEDYVHRIGRTGRANKTGIAYSLITDKHSKLASELIKVLTEANGTIPNQLHTWKETPSHGNGRNNRGGGRGGRRGGYNNGPKNYGQRNNYSSPTYEANNQNAPAAAFNNNNGQGAPPTGQTTQPPAYRSNNQPNQTFAPPSGGNNWGY